MVHDFVRQVDALAADRRAFFLSPTRWRTSRVGVPLNWTEVKFDAKNQSSVPQNRGIYAFVVKHANNHFPPHGFIMYIGITGAQAKSRTLRLRYADYLREKQKNKRPHLHYMLNKWPDDLYFYYVSFSDSEFDLSTLELDLNDSILPPVVVKDFTAEIRRLVRTLW